MASAALANIGQTTTPTGQDATLSYDAFAMGAVGQALPAASYNPYADDHGAAAAAAAAAAAMGAANPTFFQQNAFATHTQPVCAAVPSATENREEFLIYLSSCTIYISRLVRTRRISCRTRGHHTTSSSPRSYGRISRRNLRRLCK